ncbi:MAG TPA: precorrin-2 C(20)-methyltransferase [Aliidongia sp.]|nr:precorrin-2 C(20)-methyltransferase [Aliidongia sp.]
MNGTVWGLGVGPGDPELITLKALRLLRAAPILAYPAPLGGDSFARVIVAQYLTGDQVEIPIEVPMEVAPEPAQAVYDRAAERFAVELARGRDVAILCQGDPFFYGSFMYLFGRLAGRFRVEIVPGVSSLTAAAAAVQAPLAARNDVLSVLPAPLPEEELMRRLGDLDAAAIIKLGRHFAKVRRVLDALGLAEKAHYVERASLGHQRILPLAEVDPAEVPYFSMILVHRRGEAWR